MLATPAEAAEMATRRHEAYSHHTDQLLALILAVAREGVDECDCCHDLVEMIEAAAHDL